MLDAASQLRIEVDKLLLAVCHDKHIERIQNGALCVIASLLQISTCVGA
jgi:hypothetical protein